MLDRFLRVSRLWAGLAAIMLVASGCASQSYVVLLDNEDGSTGKVLVTDRGGKTTVLEKEKEGAAIGGFSSKPFSVSDKKIERDFGAAIAASPKLPRSFLLYFELASSRLTPKSEAAIPQILEEVGAYPAPEISIVGHTDTVGSDAQNIELGLVRARRAAEIIERAKIHPLRISVDSFGEKSLLVPTPDNTPEPLNRRVEVTVR